MTFSERATPQKVVDSDKLKVLTDAKAIAEEWCVPARLKNVLSHMPADLGIEGMRQVIVAMQEDILREAAGEIVSSREVLARHW